MTVVTFAIDTTEPLLLLVGTAVVLCFYFLDAYCMLLERHFRRRSEELVETVLSDEVVDARNPLVVEGPRGRPPGAQGMYDATESFAVAPLYGVRFVLLLFGYAIVGSVT